MSMKEVKYSVTAIDELCGVYCQPDGSKQKHARTTRTI